MTAFDCIAIRPLTRASRPEGIDLSSNNGNKALDSYRALQSQKALTYITPLAPCGNSVQGE